jgi:hypothetical protein
MLYVCVCNNEPDRRWDHAMKGMELLCVADGMTCACLAGDHRVDAVRRSVRFLRLLPSTDECINRRKKRCDSICAFLHPMLYTLVNLMYHNNDSSDTVGQIERGTSRLHPLQRYLSRIRRMHECDQVTEVRLLHLNCIH